MTDGDDSNLVNELIREDLSDSECTSDQRHEVNLFLLNPFPFLLQAFMLSYFFTFMLSRRTMCFIIIISGRICHMKEPIQKCFRNCNVVGYWKTAFSNQ